MATKLNPAEAPVAALANPLLPATKRANQAWFGGADYDHDRDSARLTTQMHRIVALMADGKERTLREIEDATGAPQSSVSAQLRHLRKDRFGGHTVNKRHLSEGLYVYQLVMSSPDAAASGNRTRCMGSGGG